MYLFARSEDFYITTAGNKAVHLLMEGSEIAEMKHVYSRIKSAEMLHTLCKALAHFVQYACTSCATPLHKLDPWINMKECG